MDELRDFHCGACEAEFATREELDDHLRQAHPGRTADPGLRCPTCGEPVASRAELDQHVRDAHEIPVGKPAVEVSNSEP